jgi:hypothetical protein
MKGRFYFIAGDFFSSVLTGAAAALVCRALVRESWSVVPAMAAGMALGSVTALAAGLIFMLFFGDFEIMLLGMFSGMSSGMVMAMIEAMVPAGLLQAAGLGAGIGVVPFAAVYLLDALFKKRH